MASQPSAIVDLVQLTPRRSFDVAKSFDETGQLNLVCTDFAFRSSRLARWLLPRRVSFDRYACKLQGGKLLVDFVSGILFRYRLKRLPPHLKYVAQIAAADRLAKYYLQRRRFRPGANAVYCLDSAAEAVFRESPNLLKVLEQCVAPRMAQLKAMNRYAPLNEVDKWTQHFVAMAALEQKEWQMADVILSPSDFVTESLKELGVPERKIRKLPYWTPFVPIAEIPQRDDRNIRVLFVGNDAKRKGLKDFFTIASRFADRRDIKFVIAGALHEEFRELKKVFSEPNVEFLGKVSQERLRAELEVCHVSLLPTYLEGSSVATYEAMSFGQVVLTTPQSGSIVESAVNGYVHEAGDCDSFAKTLSEVCNSRALREQISRNALAKIKNFQYQNYSTALRRIVEDELENKRESTFC